MDGVGNVLERVLLGNVLERRRKGRGFEVVTFIWQ